MTNEQLMRLAVEGYKTLIPRPGNSDFCVLGSICYAKTGRFASDNQLPFFKMFRRSDSFIAGVINGFDGNPKPNKQYSSRTKKDYDKYADGYKFGKRAAKKFLKPN